LEQADPGIHLIREDAAAFVARLKSETGGEICLMGGGELAQNLFAADLIDRVGVNIHPLLLGDGIPLFRPFLHEVKLELTELERLSHDCVYIVYDVSR
jgi:dihydrofolate reductase